MKRRTWILGALGASGALVVGWAVQPARERLGSPALMPAMEGEVALNGWIRIARDGSVVLAMPRSEMGQGTHNGLTMLVAEELDVPLARVRLEQAGFDALYGNVAMLSAALPFHPMESEGKTPPLKVRVGEWMVGKVARELGINATGGSSSLADGWEPMRLAAASARAMLLTTAALRWQLPMDQLSVQDGVVRHASGRQAHYGELAPFSGGVAPGGAVQLKKPQDWRLIGKSVQRTDIAPKVNGSARFGLDVRLPGMLFAAMHMCPTIGGTLSKWDGTAAMALPGVVKVVQVDAHGGAAPGFAVVARNSWAAQQGARLVQAEWAAPAQGPVDSAMIEADLLLKVQQDGHTFYARGDITRAEGEAARVVEAIYSAPYLAHATMEPMNCTALYRPGKKGDKGPTLQVWAPTQVPGFARAMAARAAGLEEEQVQLEVTLLGGGFGRRLDADFVGQAAQVARAMEGTPVQLFWSRAQDTTHDFYRPMHVAQLRAALSSDGKPLGLRIQSAGDAISPRWLARGMPALAGPVDSPDKTTAEGLFDLPYDFAHQHMAHVATRSGVPIGYWRSVGHSHNAFFSESFIDEVAAEARVDPLYLRQSLLRHAPRYLAVLNLAAQKAGWGQPLPEGRARGIALHESFGSIVAEVVEASLQGQTPRVHRVVCAIDCGIAVHPDSVAQQLEGSVVFALTAALYGRIDIRDGVVQQTNFTDYPMVQMQESPTVETYIVPSTRTPSGVGEPGVPPLAPALANALFALTGKRHRSLPLMGAGA